MSHEIACPLCGQHHWVCSTGGGDDDRCSICRAGVLQFNRRETEILRAVVKFLNDQYTTWNFTHMGNQQPPDFNKGQLTPEEEKAFWAKIGLGE